MFLLCLLIVLFLLSIKFEKDSIKFADCRFRELDRLREIVSIYDTSGFSQGIKSYLYNCYCKGIEYERKNTQIAHLFSVILSFYIHGLKMTSFSFRVLAIELFLIYSIFLTLIKSDLNLGYVAGLLLIVILGFVLHSFAVILGAITEIFGQKSIHMFSFFLKQKSVWYYFWSQIDGAELKLKRGVSTLTFENTYRRLSAVYATYQLILIFLPAFLLIYFNNGHIFNLVSQTF